jgi:malate dehydrogenase (quinone)
MWPVTDVVLVGAGVMSATLASLLRALDPSLSIQVFERLDRAAAESSDAWNNAGTGHAGFCELNYTPEDEQGEIDVSKAIRVCEQFEISRQLWAGLVRRGELRPDFIRPLPHMSFVWGEDDVDFLRARFVELAKSPLFAGLQLSEAPGQIEDWIPLVMQGANRGPVSATRMDIGNDVNFGQLTRRLIAGLAESDQASVHLAHEVTDLQRDSDGCWCVHVRDLEADSERVVRARFVFIGAGGGSLPLLELSGIPESGGYGGFPVSGQFLRCTDEAVVARHQAKVYGKAAVGAPPMSVPHLDTRYIGGKQELLFGPYAGFSTKFLKRGSWTDLFRSLDFDNLVPMISAGAQNLDLTRYLVGQALLSEEQRVQILRAYYPSARDEDWEVEVAGQRVQIIKSNGRGGGVLQFGTEIVTGAEGSICALLGASPGASTAVAIMLEVIERCFADRMDGWRPRLRALIPSFGQSLHDDPALCKQVRRDALGTLGLL